MMNLIRDRTPSLILFGGIQTVMWSFVYYRWREPSLITGPLPSHIPKGYIGRARFQNPERPLAHSLPQEY